MKKLVCCLLVGASMLTACSLEENVMESTEVQLEMDSTLDEESVEVVETVTTVEDGSVEVMETDTTVDDSSLEVTETVTTVEEGSLAVLETETAVESTTGEQSEATSTKKKIPTTAEEMNAMDINDFNEDVLYMDKVRVEDFSYLYEKGMTYEDHVSLQARLTRYLDYYIPTNEEKVWKAVVIEDDFVSVPALDLFYVYIEELDAVVECKRHRNDEYSQNGIPYTFLCEKIEIHDPEGPAEAIPY